MCGNGFNVVLLQSLVCLNGDVIRRETISTMPAGNAKFLMDSVFELAQRINRFRLSDAEIGLFCSVVIITAGIDTSYYKLDVYKQTWKFILISEKLFILFKFGYF